MLYCDFLSGILLLCQPVVVLRSCNFDVSCTGPLFDLSVVFYQGLVSVFSACETRCDKVQVEIDFLKMAKLPAMDQDQQVREEVPPASPASVAPVAMAGGSEVTRFVFPEAEGEVFF